MSLLEPWMDLLSAVAADPSSGRPSVLIHECQRVWPLLEARTPMVHVHLQRPPYTDFLSASYRHPLVRERIAAAVTPDDARVAVERAGLVVVATPMHARLDPNVQELLSKHAEKGRWLVFGLPQAAGWGSTLMALRRARMQPIGSPEMQVLASASVMQALTARGLSPAGLTAELAAKLLEAVPPEKSLLPAVTLRDDKVELRLRPAPTSFIASTSPMLSDPIITESRALLNARGTGSIFLPWDGCDRAKFLLRNVRAKIDDSQMACGAGEIKPEHLTYTERGAVISIRPPAADAGRHAMLHLSLPAPAVPGDGFCDFGAVEYTVSFS